MKPLSRHLPMHVVNGISVALGIVLVQTLVHAAAGAQAAALAITGAIYASLADRPLRPERTWRRVSAGALAGLAAAALLLVSRGHALATGIGIACVTFAAMMALAWGPRAGAASFAAVLSLVFTMGLPAAEPTRAVLLWQAGGALLYLGWALLSVQLLQPTYRRLALAEALQATAQLLRARAALVRGGGTDEAALRGWIRAEARLAEKLQSARDLLFAAPTQPLQQRQVAVLLRLIDLRDLLLASALELDRYGDDAAVQALRGRYALWLQGLALQLLQLPSPAPPPLADGDAPLADGDAPLALPPSLVRAIQARLQRLGTEVAQIGALMRGVDEPPLLTPAQLQRFVAPEGWPLQALLPHRAWGSPVLRHALRAAAALAAAFAIAHVLPWASHPQWLVLSVAVVLRNTFDQTVARRNLRMTGTVLGCLLVLALSYVEQPLLLSAVFIVSIGVAHAFSIERYLLTAMAGTVMALLQAHLVAPGEGFPIGERIADTVIGAALAWAFSYVLPSWERRLLPRALARLMEALRGYAAQVLTPASGSEEQAVAQRLARRQAYDALGALTASLQRSTAEPGRVRLPVQPMAQLVDQAQRLMAHLSMLRLLLQQAPEGAPQPALADTAAAVARALAPGAGGSAPDDPGEPAALEPPPSTALQPWLQWRLRVTAANAAELRRAARAALALIGHPRAG